MSDRVENIRRQLVGALKDGSDVGEVLVLAVCAAQKWLDAHPARDEFSPLDPQGLTDNRPGSWEAALVDQALESSGYYAGI